MSNNEVRFLPAPGSDPAEGTHISLTSGHACRVFAIGPDGKKGTAIPMMFRKHAVAVGCGIVGIEEPAPAPKEEGKQDLIVAAITQLIEAGSPDTLDGNGRPKLAEVKKVAGFNVLKKDLDDAWGVFVAQLGDDDKDEGEGSEGDDGAEGGAGESGDD